MTRLNTEETAFVREVIDNCLPRPLSIGDRLSHKPFSSIYATWDGGLNLRKGNGAPWPLDFEAKTQSFHGIDPKTQKNPARIMRFFNEVLQLGYNKPLRVDLADSRKFGSRGWPQPDKPRICFNRRDQGKNIMLWPLAGYHGLHTRHFARPDCTPDPHFDQRQDQIVWRGNLTGISNFLFPEHGDPGRPSRKILDDLRSPKADLSQLEAELWGVNRYRFVADNINHPDCDIKLVLPAKHQAAGETPLLRHLCDQPRTGRWLQNYKYVLCISGYDAGSNFFDAVQSGAVVFRETDGWEQFYTRPFRAWEHFIPVEPGGTDLHEKLDWARNHPRKCKDMIDAAMRTTCLFARADLREIYLKELLDSFSFDG